MRYSADDFDAAKFLGNAVGKNNPFMRKIACMNEEYREIAGFLEALSILSKDKLTKQQKEKLKLIDKVIVALGQANFKMDIVSHLSMKANADEGIADAQ
jgi:hypothetical protein